METLGIASGLVLGLLVLGFLVISVMMPLFVFLLWLNTRRVRAAAEHSQTAILQALNRITQLAERDMEANVATARAIARRRASASKGGSS